MISLARGLPIGLSALAAGLCLVIGLEVSDWPSDAASPTTVRVKADQGPVAATTPRVPDQHAAWLTEIMARPLFSPDRHPVEIGVRGLPRLTGIVVAGAQRVAIFAGPSNGRPIVAQAGARVGAYEVHTVDDDGVTVVGPEGTSTIRPVFDPKQPAAPQTRAGNLLSTRPAAK
jgi:hypothetical protein